MFHLKIEVNIIIKNARFVTDMIKVNIIDLYRIKQKFMSTTICFSDTDGNVIYIHFSDVMSWFKRIWNIDSFTNVVYSIPSDNILSLFEWKTINIYNQAKFFIAVQFKIWNFEFGNVLIYQYKKNGITLNFKTKGWKITFLFNRIWLPIIV